MILDNASFHKGGRIRELIEARGCHLLYLPPYSPDLNRIERWWARMKRIARRLLERGTTLREAVDTELCAVCPKRPALSYIGTHLALVEEWLKKELTKG